LLLGYLVTWLFGRQTGWLAKRLVIKLISYK
jgi:hypothetical protein